MKPVDMTTSVKEAIATSDRCPQFIAEIGQPCDGLEGCDDCLELAAKAVLEVVS